MWQLTEAERALHERFVCQQSAAAFVLGRALFRVGGGRYARCAASDIRLVIGQNGRPELVSPFGGNLDANISHSGEFVGCAFACGHRVGFDVEVHRQGLVLEDLVSYAFSPAERRAFAETSPTKRRDLFYSVWTAKEAILKATGEGLVNNLRAISVAETPGRIVEHRGDFRRDWHIARPTFASSEAWAAVVHLADPYEKPADLSVDYMPPAALAAPSGTRF